MFSTMLGLVTGGMMAPVAAGLGVATDLFMNAFEAVEGQITKRYGSLRNLPYPVATMLTRHFSAEATALSEAEGLENTALAYINTVRQTYTLSLKWLLGGSYHSVNALSEILEDGKMADTVKLETEQGKYDVSEYLLLHTKVRLIPSAWTSDGTVHPVVVFMEGRYEGNPGNHWDKPAYNPPIMPDGVANDNRVYYDKDGQVYTIWLLDRTTGLPQHEDWAFKRLRNANELDGSSETSAKYGNIKKEDIAISAFEGWLFNGRKNNYPGPKRVQTQLTKANFFKQPGFFSNIPVCSLEAAVFNTEQLLYDIGDPLPCPWYPCCGTDAY